MSQTPVYSEDMIGFKVIATDENGKTYPLLAFSFTYTATQADGSQVKGSFTDNYYLDE